MNGKAHQETFTTQKDEAAAEMLTRQKVVIVINSRKDEERKKKQKARNNKNKNRSRRDASLLCDYATYVSCTCVVLLTSCRYTHTGVACLRTNIFQF